MSIDLKKLERDLPSFTAPLMEVLFPLGFTPVLVGGVVRDYLLFKKIGKDWDIELTHSSLAWDLNSWKELGKALSALGKVTYLPYDIIRLEIDSFQVEFSPPRVEIFTDDHSHKNFSVEFNYQLPFETAVQRRDFTINSMGLRFLTKKSLEFLDPLNGLFHLREKVLHSSNPNFGRDPVRFLRAIRFLVKYSFTLSPELHSTLSAMKVSGFTPAYLWNEMQKSSQPIAFFQQLSSWCEIHPELNLPISAADTHRLQDISQVLPDPSKHESWMVALEWVGLASENWASYFSLSLDSARRLARWAQSSKTFKGLTPEIFQGDFDLVREKTEFQLLFDWYFTTKQILQKKPALPLMSMIEEFLPDWIHLYRFEPIKDVKHIDPPLRAKYQVWNLCQRL